jgi:hypothetical protein
MSECRVIPGLGDNLIVDRVLCCENKACEFCRPIVFDGFGSPISNPE